ncbi:fumarylacetoacetate hydrolase family protein [Nesterenkonia muleiensis]|uniref:fumarylacetoacetate hydrolase family protein n=1 Tax=Nesterenkonia muleiensis TaxID=2282648 RepID=UPI000E70C383|nr:fumarylacetoacetate hydrolase family protein [Nesterenkonia muleiensis]
MRYASYRNSAGQSTWGAEDRGTLYDLGPSGLNIAASLKDAIVGGLLSGIGPVSQAPSQPVDGTEFLTVLENPGKIICIGVNYRAHKEETGRPDVAYPTVFSRFSDTLWPHGAEAPLPAESEKYDYEGELALVIGTRAWKVSAQSAFDHVAGYAPFNDLSARDWQRHTGQWIPGKNFPSSGPFGPYYTPAEDIEDVTSLTLETRVNGEVRQHADISDLLFDIPALIEYVSTFTPLEPGDVIVTGTPGGVGLFMDPPTFLAPGDLVEVEITGLGTLTNRISD